ncbi:MAG: hypothetical protein ACPL4E_03020 [Thermoproteota archaeon]
MIRMVFSMGFDKLVVQKRGRVLEKNVFHGFRSRRVVRIPPEDAPPRHKTRKTYFCLPSYGAIALTLLPSLFQPASDFHKVNKAIFVKTG